MESGPRVSHGRSVPASAAIGRKGEGALYRKAKT